MNLTNILTNLNSSVTISNNTSEPCSEQIVSPTIPTPTKLCDEPLDASAHQSHHPKNNNNGHCIIDDNSNNDIDDDDDDDDNATESPAQQQPQDTTTATNAGSMTDTYPTETINSDVMLKHDASASVTEIGDIVATTKSHTETTMTDSTADDTDIGKRHASTDAVNGPSNDVRV